MGAYGITEFALCFVPGQGSIPDDLKRLSNLSELVLSSNHLEGALPHWIGVLPNVTDVWLEKNNFSGPVPLAWCNSTSSALPMIHLEVKDLFPFLF